MEKIFEVLGIGSKDLINIGIKIIIAIVIFILAKIILDLLSKYTKRTMDKAKEIEDESRSKQVITTMTFTRSIARYIIYFIAFALVLYLFGFGSFFSNLLVTAGVGTLAISFGAQSVIKDVVTGLLMLFEKQYAVGDFVKIGEYEGFVTAVSMRVTYLNSKGKKVIIPNGEISSVVNYSTSANVFDLVVPTCYEDDTRKIIEVLQQEVDKYYQQHQENFFEKPTILGTTSFSDSSVDITIRGKCLPLKHWESERELRLAIKERFDNDGISIPYNQLVVHNK